MPRNFLANLVHGDDTGLTKWKRFEKKEEKRGVDFLLFAPFEVKEGEHDMQALL